MRLIDWLITRWLLNWFIVCCRHVASIFRVLFAISESEVELWFLLFLLFLFSHDQLLRLSFFLLEGVVGWFLKIILYVTEIEFWLVFFCLLFRNILIFRLLCYLFCFH